VVLQCTTQSRARKNRALATFLTPFWYLKTRFTSTERPKEVRCLTIQRTFEPEARRRFQEYKNRGNESRPTEYAFDSNNAAAWVGKVASENGYDMLVTNWGAPTSYRAQTVKELTPEAEYTGFKEIPEPTYEVGDEVFLYGKYVTLTDVEARRVDMSMKPSEVVSLPTDRNDS
jgi:hypothetical protein